MLRKVSRIKSFKFIFMLTFLSLSIVYENAYAEMCKKYLNPSPIDPSLFLHQRNGQLHTSKNVEKAARLHFSTTAQRLQRPKDKIQVWLDRLEAAYQRSQTQPRYYEKFKKAYLEKYVLPSNQVPESYFENYIERAQQNGETIVLTSTDRLRFSQTIHRDQKESLTAWLDFFFGPEADEYPMWIKYWAFNNILSMGQYSHEKGTYGKRTKDQISPYPDLNHEAFSYVIDMVLAKLNRQSLNEIQDPILLQNLEGLSFSKLYGRQIQLLSSQNVENLVRTNGIWVKYPKGSDHMPLHLSLRGRNTGWCTAGKATAENHVRGGDFYVYYTPDKDNQFKIPRLAIRFKNETMEEVRGISADQNIDPFIVRTSILTDKLMEFGEEGKKFFKKYENALSITRIAEDAKNGKSLSNEDLKFMYELDQKIQGFGHKPDPSIKKFIQSRDIKADLMQIYDYQINRDQISLSTDEALQLRSLIHYGDLNYTGIIRPQEAHMPEVVFGDIHGENLKSIENLVFPQTVRGSIFLHRIFSIKGVVSWPENLDGLIHLQRTAYSNAGGSKAPPYDKVVFIDAPVVLYNFTRNEFGSRLGTIPLPP